MGKNDKDLNKIQNGIKRLTRALTLCSKNKKQQYEKDISVYIYRAKKLLWYKQLEEIKQKKQEIIDSNKQQLAEKNFSQQYIDNEIKKLISLIGDPYKNPDLQIPDYLCCKVSLDLMEEPVTTEVGHTYEKSVLDEHFKKNGFVDPITRQKINKNLYPNLSIKQGIQEFLNQNPWAFEFYQDQDYKNIEF
ncbi:u-box domain protein [Ichthyophthirius multifiliis]|uniref:RING-type E3 ubiquitin transferase n=1 Tax=Ichthyophthirius multifiliis TaxID=5932 RepID=G0R2Y4_ICHMU|nr:u-box domain protein [Ichthyophthirius multifiliis]EGR28168.1 u-box domain protein [Ichthyophthirius multifiliis]|eukprot:XP_004027513.1 u-box domain protein [Ichthyophthirius multifiliis]